MEHEHEFEEDHVKHVYHHHEHTAEPTFGPGDDDEDDGDDDDDPPSEGESMFTNPALPVVTGAGFGGGYGWHQGFQPADAALVQSNNLAILGTQMNFGFQMMQQTVSQNSKENALLTKDNTIAMLNMQNTMQMMFMQMNSKLDHIACCACAPPAPPTAKG